MRERTKYKSERRETRQRRHRFGMRVSGRSIKGVLLPVIKKRYGEIIRERGGARQQCQGLAQPANYRCQEAKAEALQTTAEEGQVWE